MPKAMWHQLVASVRLQLRNRAALAYTYAVPLLFLAAFLTLYRRESPPLGRHLGELLAVTALSGACFALPALLVSERERGVWRRYRLAPVPTVLWLGAMLGSVYLLLLSAGTLQITLAMWAGTPLPLHPFDLWVAFTLTCVAFLGIGLLIAMLADTVPAAQALGQSVFLPLLIVGGIVVPLRLLPDWMQRAAAFLPGRYAVDTLESAVTGRGLSDVATAATTLIVMGAASGLAALGMFRWEAGQQIRLSRTLTAIGVAVAAWIAIGALATSRTDSGIEAVPPAALLPPAPPLTASDPPASTSAEKQLPSRRSPPAASAAPIPSEPKPAAAPIRPPVERTWRDVTMDDVNVNLVFVDLPPDHGIVAPINAAYRPYEDVECIRRALPTWSPAAVDDLVQRTRNLLLLAGVPDLLRLEIERDVPIVVFDHLQKTTPKDDLVKVLYWIATHRSDGDLVALDHLSAACLDVLPPDDPEELRDRVAVYAMKLLGRLTGKIK